MASPSCGSARRALSASRTATAVSVRPSMPSISRRATSRPTAPRPAMPMRRAGLLDISRSPSVGKFRFSFLQEGTDAFLVVGVHARFALQVAFEIELRVEAVAGRGIERALDQCKTLRRHPQKTLADGGGFDFEAVV